MDSVWTTPRKYAPFEPLKTVINTDVLIIGGGITGLLCAYMLKRAGVDCVLTEANELCQGITRNTTAKITVGHGLLYDKLINRYGTETAHLYLEAQRRAGEEYARLCRDMDCEYEKTDSYVYSMDDCNKIEREIEALNRLGVKAEFSNAHMLPFRVEGAVRVREQAQFHPLKFLYELAKGLPIYENTKVTEVLPHKAKTAYGEIRCRKMIIATHFPMLNKHGAYFLKLYQHRSYVLALEGAPRVKGMYVDEADTGLSFRNYRQLLLLGGGGHRTGKSGGCWQELERVAQKHYPHAKIVGRWATQDCMSLDGIPYIGLYSPRTPDLFVATGFNKWGMTSAIVAATLLCDLVRGKANRYAQVFSPTRGMWHPQLAVNAWESVTGLLKPTAPRCPHLGCALQYNRAEHSWDCPCHGSRFTETGELIDNPATDGKRI